MVAGDERPWETAGMSAGPKAGDGYRASSLPYHYHFRSPYLGSCASVSHDETEAKRKLLEKILCAPNVEHDHD